MSKHDSSLSKDQFNLLKALKSKSLILNPAIAKQAESKNLKLLKKSWKILSF
jgi:hypothetical protein